jgi:hypothetical protein
MNIIRILISIILLTIANRHSLYSQDKFYLDNLDSAYMYIDSNMVDKSITHFNKIKSSEFFKNEDHFYLSICYSKIPKIDSALMLLDSAIYYGFRFEDSLQIEKSKKLTEVFKHPEFSLRKSKLFPTAANTNKIDSSLIKLFQEIKINDQKYRSGKLDSATWKLQEKLDLENQQIIKTTMFANGWPQKSIYGSEIVHTCWLVVQHSDYDLPFQKYCLELMKQNLKFGEIRLGDYAYLYDRVMLNDCKEQLYGSQFWILRDDKGKLKSIEFKPIKDSELVDRRRRYMNIPSLERYREVAKERYMDR